MEEFNFFFPRKLWAASANPLCPQGSNLHCEVSAGPSELRYTCLCSRLQHQGYFPTPERGSSQSKDGFVTFKVTFRHEIRTQVPNTALYVLERKWLKATQNVLLIQTLYPRKCQQDPHSGVCSGASDAAACTQLILQLCGSSRSQPEVTALRFVCNLRRFK